MASQTRIYINISICYVTFSLAVSQPFSLLSLIYPFRFWENENFSLQKLRQNISLFILYALKEN